MKFYLALVFCCFCITPLFSQTLLIKGVVLNAEDSLPVMQTHVTSHAAATITNDSGRFAIAAKMGDTLSVSHIAFNETKLTADSLLSVIYLSPKTVELKIVEILNVPLPSELKDHFLNLNIEQPKDSLILKKNLRELKQLLATSATPNTRPAGTLDWDKFTRAHRKRKRVEKWRKKYNIKPPD